MDEENKPHDGWEEDFTDSESGEHWAWVECPVCGYPPYCTDMKSCDEGGEHYRCPWCGTRYTVSYEYDYEDEDEDEEADR